jgi:hypothetical protein
MSVTVEEARRAVQIIQYSIRGMAELMIAGQIEDKEGLLSDGATGVLSAAAVLDLYLTGNLTSRRVYQGIDTKNAVLFLSQTVPLPYILSKPDHLLTISWPRDGTEIFQLSGDGPEVRERWSELFDNV